MKVSVKYWRSSIAVVMVVMALIVSTPMVFADDINPGVFDIHSHPYGKTYGQWSEKWWVWAFSVTSFDGCAMGQSGHVLLVGATTGGSSTRNCTIPSNKAL